MPYPPKKNAEKLLWSSKHLSKTSLKSKQTWQKNIHEPTTFMQVSYSSAHVLPLHSGQALQLPKRCCFKLTPGEQNIILKKYQQPIPTHLHHANTCCTALFWWSPNPKPSKLVSGSANIRSAADKPFQVVDRTAKNYHESPFSHRLHKTKRTALKKSRTHQNFSKRSRNRTKIM